MMKTFLVTILTLTGVLYGATAAKLELKGGDADSRRAYFAQPLRIWGSAGFLKNPEERYTIITLSNDRSRFVFGLPGKVDADGRRFGTVGMLKPSLANFYANEFFQFSSGKADHRKFELESVTAADGVCTLKFRHGELAFQLKLALPDGSDKLLLEFRPVSEAAGRQPFKIGFLVYPSSLGGGWKAGLKLRQREVLTPSRTLPVKSGFTSLTPSEFWVLFLDRYFDPAQNRGEGPCAVLFNPQVATGARVAVSNYRCSLSLDYSAGTAAAAILWDFHGQSNAAAEQIMKSLRPEFR